MGFNKVYRSLQEIFPQIDARVLRAVAIEHSKDADSAVEAVLVEIIPFFTEKSTPGAIATARAVDSPSLNAVGSADGQSGHNMNVGNLEGESNTVGLTFLRENLENNLETEICTRSHGENVESDGKDGVSTLQVEEVSAGETISGPKSSESTIKISSDGNIPCQTMSTLRDENIVANENMTIIHDKVDDAHLGTTMGTATLDYSDPEKSSSTGHDLETSPVENNVQLVELQELHGSDLMYLDKSFSNRTAQENETTLNASISQSSQVHIMDILEETIADARYKKQTLFSEMQSVISLIREVELKEQVVEQAKVAYALDGSDILAKLEEFKQRVQHDKEWNSMHAGEVYGEKAILATELKELQSRVLSLSDERDISITVLDEMRQTLEMRLAAYENEIKFAEQEKLEKKKAAKEALDEQELLMEKLVQESKILKQQAEENTRLQAFLVDRGRVVDMLQGEIAVICHDVKLLKESFDENVPFRKSLSSSQKSCILASSASSSKELNPDVLVPDGADSLVAESERDITLSEGKLTKDDRKALMDEGWELFDDREVFV